MPSIHLAWNPKHVIAQWVGTGTDRFIQKIENFKINFVFCIYKGKLSFHCYFIVDL